MEKKSAMGGSNCVGEELMTWGFAIAGGLSARVTCLPDLSDAGRLKGGDELRPANWVRGATHR